MSDLLQLDCGEQLTIAQVNQLHGQMAELLNQDKDVECNIESVQRCDTAGIQLLAHFNVSLKASQRRCLIAAENETVTQVASYLGLEEFVKPNL